MLRRLIYHFLLEWRGYPAAKLQQEIHMPRPIGVTIIAVICFLGAAFGLIVGGRATLVLQSKNAGGDSDLATIVAGLVLLGIVFPALYALAGWGLWKLKNWGRILTVVLAGLAAAFELLRWVFTSHMATSLLITTVFSLVLNGVIIFYLLKSNVGPHFQRN